MKVKKVKYILNIELIKRKANTSEIYAAIAKISKDIKRESTSKLFKLDFKVTFFNGVVREVTVYSDNYGNEFYLCYQGKFYISFRDCFDDELENYGKEAFDEFIILVDPFIYKFDCKYLNCQNVEITEDGNLLFRKERN